MSNINDESPVTSDKAFGSRFEDYSSSSSSRRSPLILSSWATRFNSAIAIAMAEFSFISMLLSPSQRINTLAWGNERSERSKVIYLNIYWRQKISFVGIVVSCGL